MATVDPQSRDLTLKLVYYGPALSGKTTNLRRLHARAAAGCGRLVTLDTQADRTLFFDLLPLHFRASGAWVRIKIYTVPGQVLHDATRRVVLRGVDGVVFVADSRPEAADENHRSWKNLRQNLREVGLDPAAVPVVVQWNKRDLPAVRPEVELADAARRAGRPLLLASALQDEGVLPTFFTLAAEVWDHLEKNERDKDEEQQMGRACGVERSDFLNQLRALFDVHGMLSP